MTIYRYSDGKVVKNAGGHDIENGTCRKCKHRFRANKTWTPYATGGLNTKTGPAWLDGTPSKPELILNARDTQNFIELKDTLAAIKNSGDVFGGNSNYYNIDIQVDQMSSDYDVDRAIERLRNRINEINAYSSVNNLSRLR
jgi:hypothetical protein